MPIKCMLSPNQLQVERRERIDPIKCMRSPHTQLQVERRESHSANQVYALVTHTATGGEERVIVPIKCMRSPKPATGGEERET